MEEGTLKRLHRVGRERLNTAISSAARKSFLLARADEVIE
jgi:hypothetical protein